MPTTELKAVLAEAYGLTDITLDRLLVGGQTDNYRGVLPSGEAVFVKAGRPERCFRYSHAEARTAAEMSEIARTSGVPAPSVRRNREHDLVTRTPNGVLTVWDFIDADPQTQPLTPDQAEEAGWILGRLHRRFEVLPAQGLTRRGDNWISGDPDRPIRDARALIETIENLPCPTPADLDRYQRLQRRVERLEGLPDLRRGLPESITRGLGHGDYTRVNLLWRGDGLAGVLDFLGHDVPFAWELGRIAFDTFTVATSPTWRQAASACAYGYKQANPRLSPDDLLAMPLMAALDGLCFTYVLHEHYHCPNPIKEVQEGFTQFWFDLDTTVLTILDDLENLQAGLSDLF